MAALRQLLDAGGGVAVVSGEAGIGKSRLVREFAAEAAQRGRVVVWARPEEVAEPGPYALIIDLLESIAEQGGLGVKTDARSLANALVPSDSASAPGARAARTVAAEIRGLLAQLGGLPLVALEDLHWGDEASHSVALHLARAARDDGHLFVATFRPEAAKDASLNKLLDTMSRDRISLEVRLEPLGAEEVASMVEAMWSRPPTAQELAKLLRLGEGIPFFVEELSSEPLAQDSPVPASVGQAIRARILGLEEDARQVLTTASLMVGAIDSDVLAVAAGMSRDQALDHLSAAAAAGLVSDHEGKLGFRHALIRETVARGVLSVERVQIHRALAKAIETAYESDLERHATALLIHYREAGDVKPAARWGVLAGNQALALASMEDARAAFMEAVELSRRTSAEAIAGLGEAELREGNEEKAAALFREAAEKLLAEGRNEEAAMQLGRRAWALQASESPGVVANALEEALSWLKGRESGRAYAELLVQKGIMLALLFRQFDEAQPILLESVEAAERLDAPALLATSLDGLAWVVESRGSHEEARAYGERAVDAADRSTNAEIIGRTHNNLAVRLAWHGDPQRAVALLDGASEQLRRNFGSAGVAAIDVTHAWVARLMGRPIEVVEFCVRGRAAWSEWQAYRRTLEVWAAIERWEFDRARLIVDAAWDEIGGLGVRELWLKGTPEPNPIASQTLHAEALLRIAAEEASEAVLAARALVSVDQAGNDYFDQGLSLTLLVRAFLLAGDSPQAEETLDHLGELAAQHSFPYLQACTSELRGLWRLSKGDGKTAFGHFNDASTLFRSCSNMADYVRCTRLTAERLIEFGSDGKSEAIEQLRRVRTLSQEEGLRLEQNRVEALMRGVGVRTRAGRPRKSAEEDGALSPREAEVAVLVAAGSTNVEIAQRLFLSERTVQDHITHALRKLSLPSRAALASWAAKQGMV